MNKKINPLNELLLYCRRYAALLIIAMILGAACALFSVIGPNKIADMVDSIEQGLRGTFDLEAIGAIGIFLAVLYGLGIRLSTAVYPYNRNAANDAVAKNRYFRENKPNAAQVFR